MLRALPAVIAVVLFALGPPGASAQPARTFSDLPLHVDLDESVRVTDLNGKTTSGILTRITPTAIELRVGGVPVRFPADTVREVRVRGDGLLNGAIIGLAAGAILGAAAAGNFADGFRAGDALQGALILGGIGAGIGVAADALVAGSRLVYRGPPSPGARSDPPALVWYVGVSW